MYLWNYITYIVLRHNKIYQNKLALVLIPKFYYKLKATICVNAQSCAKCEKF